MPGAYDFWDKWKNRLSQWQLKNFAAIVLESGGVFNILLSQAIHLTKPLFPTTNHQELVVLADLLEEPQACQAFVKFLNEDIDR